MCRFVVFLKDLEYKKKYVDKFLSQAYCKKNTPGLNNDRDFDYHKDGYGFLFFQDNKWSIYKSSLMYQDDNNIKFIEDKIIQSNILIGHIRATKHHFKDDVCYNNTHPFWFNNHYWMHNGSVHPLDYDFFKTYIDKKYLEHIKGTTDSELMFYIFLTIQDKVKNLSKSWIKFLSLLKKFYLEKEIVISANLVYCNCNKIIISRFINNNEEPPSLYFDIDKLIISSEPLSKSYEIVSKNTYIVIDINTKNIEILNIS